MGLYGLNIGWDVARVFLIETTLKISLLDFLYSSGDSNHDVSGPFRHFGYFFVFHSLMIQFV
jgi:hypothetical protein